MLVDLHGHTGAISRCCRIGAEENVLRAREAGFDGMVITNHYDAGYFNEESYNAWLEGYITEWAHCRALGKQHGVRIFCGVEVNSALVPNLHLLIYGADEAFLRKYPRLCNRTTEELYRICKENGCALIQAHPFRHRVGVQDTAFLDGLEINCHPSYGNSYCADVLAAAQAKHLAVTAGCDYHADSYRSKGGTFLPNEIQTEQELAQYLLKADQFHLQVQEPADGAVFEIWHNRNRRKQDD